MLYVVLCVLALIALNLPFLTSVIWKDAMEIVSTACKEYKDVHDIFLRAGMYVLGVALLLSYSVIVATGMFIQAMTTDNGFIDGYVAIGGTVCIVSVVYSCFAISKLRKAEAF